MKQITTSQMLKLYGKWKWAQCFHDAEVYMQEALKCYPEQQNVFVEEYENRQVVIYFDEKKYPTFVLNNVETSQSFLERVKVRDEGK
jgi:hypothetical protein